MNLFRSTDYRKIISKLAEVAKTADPKFSLTQLALTLGIQGSFLSKVLSGKFHFSSDQMYLVCKTFKLNSNESAYLQLLLEWERAAISERKSELLARIRLIQASQRTTRKHLKSEFIEGDRQKLFEDYYLNPYCPIVHAFMSIAEYQGNTELVGKKLGLRAVQMREILDILERLEVIRWSPSEKRYEVLLYLIQLPEDARLIAPSHALFKFMALNQALRLPRDQKYTYSSTVSIDEHARDRIKEDFMLFLRKAETHIQQCAPTRVFEMSFDLFPWDY